MTLERLLLDPRPTLLHGNPDDVAPTRLVTPPDNAETSEGPGEAAADHAGEPRHGGTAAPPDGRDPATLPEDAFVLLWPALAAQLGKPLTEREVAERFKLELTQARAWLKRAVDEGLAEVEPRPKRYVLRRETEEQLRIDAQ